MALICLRCASESCSCGLLATVMAIAPKAEVIAGAIESPTSPVMLSSRHIIAAANDPTAAPEPFFVLKPRDD